MNTKTDRTTEGSGPQGKMAHDQTTLRTGQGNGVMGQREGKGGNRKQKNPDGSGGKKKSS